MSHPHEHTLFLADMTDPLVAAALVLLDGADAHVTVLGQVKTDECHGTHAEHEASTREVIDMLRAAADRIERNG